MTIHRTLPAEADLHESGWWDGGNGWEYVKLPLVDTKRALPDGTPLFARLAHADLKAFAASHGYELWEEADFEVVRAGGVVVEPCTIFPDTQELAGSIDHDTRCWALIRKSGWDGSRPVLGAGKAHRAGAPKGRAYLGGWPTAHLERYGPRHGAGYVQRIDEPKEYSGAEGPHGDDIFDYGTLAVLKRRAGAGAFKPFVELGEAAVDLVEDAYEDFLHWFGIDGLPAARDGHDAADDPHAGPEQLPDLKTPATPAEVFACLGAPTRAAKLVLLAQWDLETARGRSMHNYNIGNVKGRPGDAARCWQFFKCGEELTLTQARAATSDPRVTVVRTYQRGVVDMASVAIMPEHPGCCFRAFRTLREGVADYELLLKMQRYMPAYQRALAGDIEGFGVLLGRGGYYTAPVEGYVAELGRRRAALEPLVPA